MPHEVVNLVIFVLVFGIPLSAIWTSHSRKVLAMKLQLNSQGDNNLKSEVEALRSEIRSLRDTTMQYDLSFDTALQRVESRLDHVERNSRTDVVNQPMELRNGR